jgi:hypothetical protein
MGVYDAPIISGQPGTTWTNDTGEIRYQFVCDLVHTCGTCLQFHLKIGQWWPLPLHRNCRCHQEILYPGATGRPFVNFLDVLRGLTHAQQVDAVGASVYKLLEAGLITWTDAVSETGVWDLKEIVWKLGLTIEDMVDAGVSEWIAEAAFVAAHAAEITDTTRLQALIDQLRDAGMSDDDIRKLLEEGIRDTVGLGGVGMGVSDDDVEALLGGVPVS